MVSAGRTRIVCAVLSFLGFIPLVAEAVPDPRLRVPPFVPEQRRTLQQLQLTNGGEFVSRDYAPVPEASKGPPMPSGQGYRVEELGSGAYMVTDGVAQIMVVVGEGVTVLVNAPDTLALLERGEDGLSDSLLPEIIRAIVPSPVTHIIYTHSHLVHIGAAGPVVAAFREEADLEIVALEETAQVISALNDYSEQNGLGRRVPEPTLTFATSYTLTDAAGRTLLQLEQMAPAHDRGVLRVIHPDSGTLYVVDVIWPGWAPFQGFATSGDVLGFVMSHYVVLDLFDNHNISTIIGGRTNLKGDRSHVATQLAYVEDIVATVRSIMDPEGDNFITEDLVERLQVTVPGHPHFGNMWLVTGVFFEEVASRCERIVLSKLGVAGLPIGTRWTDVLAAADVFTRDTCWAMAIADRIDMHGAALAQPYVLP